MRALDGLYRTLARLAAHRLAQLWLVLVGLTEAVFLPFPVDGLLAPMVLVRPKRWLYYTVLATLSSVAGGTLGYLVGLWFFDVFESLLINNAGFLRAQDLFARYGFVIILVAASTPLPYKFFVIAAGVAQASLPILIIASLAARGPRFLLVALVCYYFGTRARHLLRQWVSLLNWVTLTALIALAVWYFFLR